MKLYEYQGRQILETAGIPTPNGIVVASAKEIESHKNELSFPVVLKAQVLVGGRGKAGGILFADDLGACKAAATNLLAMSIKGLRVRRILIVPKLTFTTELYLGALIDRSTRNVLIMASARGGVDIEGVDEKEIHRVQVNPLVGLPDYARRRLARRVGLSGEQARAFGDIVSRLFDALVANDCELLEINPLAATDDGRIVAADAKAIVNDGALFRHPDLEVVEEEYTPLEREARQHRIAFVQLDGRIGVIANGAGLTMATLDALTEFKGRGGVFLDLGGTDDVEQVKRAFALMRKAKPAVVLLNLFGGITKCDTVALGIKQALDEQGHFAPIVARIKGTNAKEAQTILEDAGLTTAATLQDAAKAAIAAEGRILEAD